MKTPVCSGSCSLINTTSEKGFGVIEIEEPSTKSSVLKRIPELKRKINENISKPKILISDKIEQADYLNSVQMLSLYRLIQEGIQNSIKHANANCIKIHFLENQDMLNISIHDDGNGFDTESKTNGNGLGNMKSRCESSNGKFEITSSDNGTLLSCIISKK